MELGAPVPPGKCESPSDLKAEPFRRLTVLDVGPFDKTAKLYPQPGILQQPAWRIMLMNHPVETDTTDARWFAVWTRSCQKNVPAAMLHTFGLDHLLALKSEFLQWSDRKQTVSVPLFCGYLFVSMKPTKNSRLEVLKAPAIVGTVGDSAGQDRKSVV